MEYYNAMQTGFKVIGFVSEFATLLENVDKVLNNPNVEGIEKASLGLRVVTVSLSALEIFAKQYGCSLTTQKNIKDSELIIRLVDIPVKFAEAAKKGGAGIIENGIFLPSISFLRCMSEDGSLHNNILANGPEEGRKEPIKEVVGYERDWEGDLVPVYKTVGYKQLTPEECIQRSHECDYNAVVLRTAEVAVRANLASKSLDSYKKLRDRGVRVANPMPNVPGP